jgi:polysaccharide pyruvyl transferase WcaK-like protein
MTISRQLDIYGKKVLLAGFRSHQNMWDELILLGNIKLLQQQKKEIYVIAHDPKWIEDFLKQSIDTTDITFLQEMPRGIRSIWKYIVSKKYKQIKSFFTIDTIILGGGEILTEESPHAYYYRLRSIRPALFLGKTLYLMGGIQIPKKRYNRLLCKRIFLHTKKIYSRDKEEIENIQTFGYKDVDFFMDTSYFALDNRKKYYHISSQKYIIININSKWLHYLPELCKEIIDYAKEGYTSTYISVCKGISDDDSKHFNAIQQMLPNMYKSFLQQKDRSEDFIWFIKYLGGAHKVISTRLHLFLISEFIGIETQVYPYQKKINKMKKIIDEMKDEI